MSFTDIGSSLSPITSDFGTFSSNDPAVSNNGLFTSNSPIQQRIDNSTPERLYRIGFGAAANFNVSLSQLTDNADLSIIYDQNNNGRFDAGEEIAKSTNLGTASESISLTNLNSGTYYIYVHGATPTVQTSFVLNGGFTVGYPISTPIATGSSLNSITRDWGTNPPNSGFGSFLGTEILDRVQFTRSTNLQLNFSSSASGSPVTANMQVIRDANSNGVFDPGEEVINSTGTTISLSNLAPGTYYFHLYRTQSTVAPFQYSYNFSAPESVTPISDDTLATAQSITLGSASIQDSVSNTDPNDFYKFTLTQSGIFTANLTGLTGDADVRLIQDKNNNGTIDPAQVYNSTTGLLDPGEILAWQWERGTGSEAIRRFLTAGTYYVQVNSYNNQTANYTLGTGFTAAASDPQRFTITPTYDNNINATARATIQKAINFWQNIILSVDPNAGTTRLPQNIQLPFSLDTNNQAPANGAQGGYQWNSQNGITRWTSGYVIINPQYLNTMNNQPNEDPSIMIHEIGHVLGLVGMGPNDPNFNGTYPANTYAGSAYGELLGTFTQTAIPLDGGHWSEQVFSYETMTPTSNTVNSFSQLSIAALRDAGWSNITNINFGAAQPYQLPARGLAIGAPISVNRGTIDFSPDPAGYYSTPNGNVSNTNFNQIWRVILRPNDNRLSVDLNSVGNADLRLIEDRNKNGIFDAGEQIANLTDPTLQTESITVPVTGNGNYYIVVYQPVPGQTIPFNLRVESFVVAG